MSPSDEYFRSYPNHHDVFISYAQLDKPIADAVCAKLESRHLRCWIAPRDVVPGKSFPEAIIDGIVDSRVVVLIFSSHANNSPHVIRELTTAVNKGRIIVPFRVEDVMPSKSMEYLISVPHWLDAITPPLEKHIDELAGILERILLSGKEPGVCSVCKTPLSPNAKFCDSCGTPVSMIQRPQPSGTAPVITEEGARFIPPAPPEPAQEELPLQPSQPPEPAPAPRAASPPHSAVNRNLLIGAGVAVLVLVGLFALLPMINGSPVPFPGFQNVSGGTTAGNATENGSTINYRGSDVPVNTVLLTAGPTQVMTEGTQLFVQADKDSLNAEVSVQFTGGPGQGLVKDNRVILTRSDGTVTEGKLDFSQRLSEVSLQGSRGTDRLQVIVTMYSGATYTIVDKLMPYRVRSVV
jgi:hypothetical protein